MEGNELVDEELPMDISPMHVRHCIGLLRQSLMCLADTTVETKDIDPGGVHRFRIEHRYRDWNELITWTTEQQAQEIGNHKSSS